MASSKKSESKKESEDNAINLDQIKEAYKNEKLLSLDYEKHWSWRLQQCLCPKDYYQEWLRYNLDMYEKYLRVCPLATLTSLAEKHIPSLKKLKNYVYELDWEDCYILVGLRAVSLHKGKVILNVNRRLRWDSFPSGEERLKMYTNRNKPGGLGPNVMYWNYQRRSKWKGVSILVPILWGRCKSYIDKRYEFARFQDRLQALTNPQIRWILRTTKPVYLIPRPLLRPQDPARKNSLIPPCIQRLRLKQRSQKPLDNKERFPYQVYWLQSGRGTVESMVTEWKTPAARRHYGSTYTSALNKYESDLKNLQPKVQRMTLYCKPLIACDACPFKGDGAKCAKARLALQPSNSTPENPLTTVYRPDQW